MTLQQSQRTHASPATATAPEELMMKPKPDVARGGQAAGQGEARRGEWKLQLLKIVAYKA